MRRACGSKRQERFGSEHQPDKRCVWPKGSQRVPNFDILWSRLITAVHIVPVPTSNNEDSWTEKDSLAADDDTI
jgi:hypothetical protein